MDRIFYKTDLIDAYSGYPIYIFDTSYLPSPQEVEYDLFIPTIMQWLPKTPYVVILFSCGLNKINWVWGISFLKAFLSQTSTDTSNAENVHKVIAVHESWFVKSVSQIFTNFLVSRKTLANLNSLISSLKLPNNLLISCDSLSDLSYYVDVAHLKISLNVYRHDYQTTLSPEIMLHTPFTPIIDRSTKISPRTDPVFYHHFYQIFNIVDSFADQVQLLFHIPGKKINTEILFHCLRRNQVIWINDWDLNCVASCFKRILSEISSPLIDPKKIILPMRDDLEYTTQVLDSMMTEEYKSLVLLQIISLSRRVVDHGLVTKHTNVSILKCLSHTLTQESISYLKKDMILIVVRFYKNLIHHWPQIHSRYRDFYKPVQDIVSGKDLGDVTIDDLYNISHGDVTDSESSSEDHFRKPNTNNMLSSTMSLRESRNSIGNQHPAEDCHENQNLDLPRRNEEISQNLTASTQGNSDASSSDKRTEALFAQGDNVGETHMKLKTKPSIQIQYPPQKYKFERLEGEEAPLNPKEIPARKDLATVVKKPVIRGRKVSELTKIFEERSQAMKILNTM